MNLLCVFRKTNFFLPIFYKFFHEIIRKIGSNKNEDGTLDTKTRKIQISTRSKVYESLAFFFVNFALSSFVPISFS